MADLSQVVNIADLRRLAERRLPRAVFDYIDGGADAEFTLRENCAAFDRITFRPRCAVATAACDLKTEVVGTSISMPLILGPVGSSRMFYPRGEEAAARAAGAAGTLYTLSTLSGCKLEDVRKATTGPAWYQVYLCGGRDVATGTIQRARDVGYSALVLTIDTPVAGLRERDARNGIKQILKRQVVPMIPHVWQFASKPGWLVSFLRDGGLMKFPNVVLPDTGPMLYADVGAALEQSMVAWDDLRWIRKVWSGPIVVKGVHIAEDARRAVNEGADAIVVSNHGGRQLDGVRSTIETLPEVVEAVGKRTEVLVDGGIRRGSDVVKALCLGAKAVLIGRAYAYGLGAGGGEGVRLALDILKADIVRTMKLLGCASVAELDRSYVDIPAEWPTGAARRRQPVA
ncbi:MAG TPA: alpha-hydroxy acid oxidase [Vicinamibacterales bacterium]|jgi:L-lactate dehydrogenase (cytochrome)|nr:alpha-hydroxy acid oxidase [Vicinamibacterales bacterium]